MQAPKGLADTQGLQAMQAKLGLDLSHNARAKAALHKTSHATKVAVMPPIAANQDNSALGMSMGVPPMNPAQPMGAPPPQSMPPQGGMPAPMPPGGMPPQQGGMPMPQDPSMQGAGAMGGTPPDPNAMPMAAPGGPPGSMPPPAPQDPNAPPMPGDQPPAVQNSGNLVSGLAAQQESMDENDPAAAAEEIGIEAAPGLATGMPKLGAERETPGYAKPLPMAATAVGLSGAGLLVSRYGKSLLKQRDAIRKLWESRMNQETAKRFGRVPTTPDAAKFDRAFKRPDAGLPLPPRDAEATRAYGAILQLPAAMVGARALYDSSRTPSTPQVASNLGLKNGTFAAPEFKGKKMIRDPYIEKLDKLKKMGSISDFAHSFMTRCAEKNVNFKEAAIKFAKDFGFSDACVELSTAMLVAGEREKQADAWGAHSPQAAAVGMTMGMAPSHSYNRPAATTQTAAAPMPKNPPISTVPMAQPRRMTAPGMKTGSCMGSEAKSKKKPGYFTTQSKKTAGLWDIGRKAMGWAMGKAPGMANKAQGAASAAGKFVHPQPNPGAWQNWMSGMTPQAPAGVNRTWSDFGKSMFQGGPQGPASYTKNTPWSNLGNRVMGAAQGAMAGSAVEGRGEDSTWSRPGVAWHSVL
jgi:hypothetical protein